MEDLGRRNPATDINLQQLHVEEANETPETPPPNGPKKPKSKKSRYTRDIALGIVLYYVTQALGLLPGLPDAFAYLF